MTMHRFTPQLQQSTLSNDMTTKIWVHPPYSSHLAASDYFLFWNLKETLCTTYFSDNQEVIHLVEERFPDQSNTLYVNITHM